MKRYRPREQDERAIMEAVKALTTEQIVALYQLLPYYNEDLRDDPVGMNGGDDSFARRVVLREIFQGSYTAEQLRPYLKLP